MWCEGKAPRIIMRGALRLQVLAYVEEVLAGAGSGDAATGRALLSLVNSVPNLSAEAFADVFASGVKDLLMVSILLRL